MLLSAIYYRNLFKAICLLGISFQFMSCNPSDKGHQNPDNDDRQRVLKRIRETGVLRTAVDYNSTNYFVYRGKPMGFNYELLQALSEDLDVKLEIVVINRRLDSYKLLQEGELDLVAKNLAVTSEGRNEADFTIPLLHTSQVLVQREIGMGTPDSLYVYSTLGLAGKKIHVQKYSSFYQRLMNLSEETGDYINIVQDSINSTEQLIAKVAGGEINYTVSDENVARLNKNYFPNLDVSVKVSFPQNIAWAVPKGSAEWKNYLDTWIADFTKTRKFRQIYHRYFESPRSATRLASEFHSISGGKISVYDETIKKLAAEYNWDWRLIASVVYHESRFNPEIESWAGAYGLMQLVPETAKALGIEDYTDPAQNIKGGILMLNWLNERLLESVPDSAQRMKFVLAAYNVGLGHVKDAQRLAKKYGKNSQVWDNNVDYYLLHKSSEKYYKDPVVRWGYCRGEQPYNYVNRVVHNYKHYLNVIPK